MPCLGCLSRMQEIRLYGSEGGEAKTSPPPISFYAKMRLKRVLNLSCRLYMGTKMLSFPIHKRLDSSLRWNDNIKIHSAFALLSTAIAKHFRWIQPRSLFPFCPKGVPSAAGIEIYIPVSPCQKTSAICKELDIVRAARVSSCCNTS
ncbi:hypothetical protein ASN18_0312 [Candidatus Magnetominusculus xianensis]|uniref:Uncharacterized protein n=1 Tax=Candidatus Magnetominusculus xianensis TaxID=1748249 RepID=A0ABR5SJ20_9BACT|nr:hypothetical protein ASN18_0312 [Candidatus Magnetominusculus xianensis]